jgi:hypothetical protein
MHYKILLVLQLVPHKALTSLLTRQVFTEKLSLLQRFLLVLAIASEEHFTMHII